MEFKPQNTLSGLAKKSGFYYITPRLIAMPFPDKRANKVGHQLMKLHKDKYSIINLSEYEYEHHHLTSLNLD